MFRTVFAFELRAWLRSPVPYVFAALLGVLFFMASSSDNVQVGQSFDNLLKNAPYVVQSYYAYLAGLSLLLVTAFVQGSALRDVNARSQEIIYTTPLKKTPYLMGRFAGAFAISVIAQLGGAMGILLGGMAPWLDPERVGPVVWGAHFYGLVAFTIPSTFFTAALVFVIAAITRKTAATFVGAITVLVFYSMAEIALADLDNERVGAMIDAFGIGTYEFLTQYWTVAERNSQYLTLTGDLLLNRVLWIAVSLALLAAGLKIFRFTIEERSFNPFARFFGRGKDGRRASDDDGAAPLPQMTVNHPLPAAATTHAGGAHFRQMLSQAWLDLKGVYGSIAFRVILLMALINGGFALAYSADFFGLSTWPVTYQQVDTLRGTMLLFIYIVIVLYAGDLVWKERMARMDQIHDAMPHPIWSTAVGKILALTGVIFSLHLLMVGMGVASQLLRGYTDLDLGVWAMEILVLDTLTALFTIVIAVMIQALVNNRFVGYFATVAFLLANIFVWGPLKMQSVMLRFGTLPGHIYSDMAGYGPYGAGLAWFTAYWLPAAAIIVVGSVLLWVRGVDTSRPARRRNARLRFSGGVRPALAVFAVAWVGLGGWVFYNTKVLNAYTPRRDAEDAAVEYETRYKAAYDGMLQPRATDLRYEIDLDPAGRDLRSRGEAIWVNPWDEPIDTIMVNFTRRLDWTLEIEGASEAREDEDLQVTFYAMNEPLQPGQEITATWTADYITTGFENQVSVTQVVQNGTFFNNGFITPTLGYDNSREMTNRNERRKRELPERPRMPSLERDCGQDCMSTYITDDADWVTMETVISTTADQIAVAPGSLREEWEEDGRRYYRYALDHPSLAFNSFISADYEVARETLERQGMDPVNIEVYYDGQHTYNVDKMLRSVRRSLEYFGENFGPYRHSQARIIEFPRYASFAQAFPGTMPYSEGIGFIARIEDEDDIDMVYYVTAHEMAHQWWAHQVIGSGVEGATVLSETLAQYSAIMVMEREYGQEAIHKFLRYEMDNYLQSRGAETMEEKPLMRVDASQGYVHYRKGSVILYYLKEMIGEDALNSALRSLTEDFAYAGPPYPTSYELVDRIRAVTPDSLQYLITDAFERIVLFDNKVTGDPEMQELEDGRWRVTFDVSTAKFEADAEGAETETEMNDYVDVAVLGRPEEGRDRGAVLAQERRQLTAGTHTIELIVDEQPWQVGVDPNFYLIDRVPGDNLKRVRVETEGAAGS